MQTMVRRIRFRNKTFSAMFPTITHRLSDTYVHSAYFSKKSKDDIYNYATKVDNTYLAISSMESMSELLLSFKLTNNVMNTLSESDISDLFPDFYESKSVMDKSFNFYLLLYKLNLVSHQLKEWGKY